MDDQRPEGFEFNVGEMGSGSFKGTGEIKLDHKDCYRCLTYVAYGPQGLMD